MTDRAVPEAKFADLGDDFRMHYHETGEGFPVVFIHGSGPGASGWSNFKGNYPEFAKAGLRAIIPDLPGYGYSSKPRDVEYTLDYMAGRMQDFLTALGIERCALVGNSLGGAISIRMALNEPERIEKLVLMAPGGLEEREVYMQMEGIQTMMKTFFSKEGLTREGMKTTFRLQLYDPSIITDALIEERFQIAETQPKRVIGTMKVGNLSGELSNLTCPVLGFWGVNDKFCPVSGAMTMAKSIANAQVILLSKCGHWVMVEHADTFNRQCVQFLTEAS